MNARTTSSERSPKVLAISSGGGHWVQLLRLRSAFEGCEVTYATVSEGYRSEADGGRFRIVRDGNRQRKIALLLSAWSVFVLLLTERPQIVISTGAAPGYFAMYFGKMLGMKTIWVDSVANAEELSLSGQKVASCADLWLTQWPHLAVEGGPSCFGSVL